MSAPVTYVKPKPISLDQQIEEVEYELDQRRRVYARISAREPRKKSELEYHTRRMDAVLRTLQWMRDNRAELVAKVLERQD
jgi:phage shock protein A